MKLRHLVLTATAIALLAGVTAQSRASEPTIQVVADAACPYYADDISGFATCEGEKVVRPDPLAQAVTIRGSAIAVAMAAGGRAAAPTHRSRGQATAAPRR